MRNYSLHLFRLADQIGEHFAYWQAYKDFGKTERNKQRKMVLLRINRLRKILDEMEAKVGKN